jgi:hypothetical protein
MALIGRSKRGTVALVAVTAVSLLVAGASLASGGGEDRANHPRRGTSYQGIVIDQQMITGQGTNGGCRMGYDTQTSFLVPPDDSTADNVAAATVNIRKTCQGAVVGSFVTEVSTAVAGDFVHIDMRATCTGTGGMTNPCTVGQVVFASPGHTFMKNAQSSVQTHSVQMVWPALKRGLWRFEVLPGGNNSGNLQFRSFVVEAFAGG